MRTLGAGIYWAIGQEQFVCTDLYEIDVGGVTYYLTSCDRDLTGIAPADVETYTATNIDRERIRASDGLQVDDLDVSIAHDLTAALGSKTWVDLALDGDLDEAPVRVYRAYLNPSGWSVVGCYLRFQGVVSTADPGSTTLRIVSVVSSDDFSRPFPSFTYEQFCIWNFAGPGCEWVGTVDFTVTADVTSTNEILAIDTLPGGITDLVQFLSGTVTSGGIMRTIIASEDVGALYHFTVSPAFPVAVTGSVTLSLGCRKWAATCETSYDNLTHYMGAPIAPAGN